VTDAAFADPRLDARLTRDSPARRIGRAEEVGPLAVYLASAASDFMTGQTVYLDGGHSAARAPRVRERAASPRRRWQPKGVTSSRWCGTAASGRLTA
jgi:hypothetical protein